MSFHINATNFLKKFCLAMKNAFMQNLKPKPLLCIILVSIGNDLAATRQKEDEKRGRLQNCDCLTLLDEPDYDEV